MSAAARTLTWVYCAVEGQLPATTLQRTPRLPGGRAPRVVKVSDSRAIVVADVDRATYAPDAIHERMQDVEWISRCGAAHHAVAQRIVERTRAGVVPLRLFTLFSDEDRAREAMSRRARALDAALARVAGRVEWVLRVYPGAAGATSTTTAAAGTEVAGSGTAFLVAKRDARRAAQHEARRLAAGVEELSAGLERAADDVRLRPVEPSTGLLLDAACLVPFRAATRFRGRITALSQDLREAGCRVVLTGPWPPYSFVSLDGPPDA